MTQPNDIGVIVLAAGSSSRLGQSKQMLPINQQSLLHRSAETAYACCGPHTVVVLGAQAKEHEALIADLPVHKLINNNWENGMGSSLKVGLKYILDVKPPLQAIIVMVCDQPFVTREHLENLIQKYRTTPSKITASTYAGTAGVPALFDQTMFDSILKIDDEHGAKKIIEDHSDATETVDFPEGALDIDTPEDLQAFLKQSQQKQP